MRWPIFKRVRLSGFYAWYVRYRDPFTGVDIKKSAGKTKADADRLPTKIKGEILEGTYESKQRQLKVTFFEIADDFMAYSRARKKSWTKDEQSVKKLREFFGDIPCGQFRRSMIDQYIASRKKLEHGVIAISRKRCNLLKTKEPGWRNLVDARDLKFHTTKKAKIQQIR